MSRSHPYPIVVVALAALAGCGTIRGNPSLAAPHVSEDDYLATVSPDRMGAVVSAEREVREAVRRADRAGQAVPLAEQELAIAQADVGIRAVAVDRARAQVDLVKMRHQARLYALPAGHGDAPEAEAPADRLDAAEYALEVARWEHERAESLLDLRRREVAYARAFGVVARRQVEVARAAVRVAKARAVAEGMSRVLPGISDPRVARVELSLRETELGYARAYADAAARLADVEVRRQSRARFEAGRPSMLTPPRSGSSGITGPAPLPPEPTALPWPAAAAVEPGPATAPPEVPAAGRPEKAGSSERQRPPRRAREPAVSASAVWKCAGVLKRPQPARWSCARFLPGPAAP